MEPYFVPNDPRWPDGPYLQVAVLPDLGRDADLKRLLSRGNQALADYPGFAPLPPQWLHVTIQACLYRPAAEIPAGARAALIDALVAVGADIAPFSLQAGSLLAGGNGVVADLHPDDQINALFERVRGAIRGVLGDQAVTKDSRPAHLALGYARAVEDSGRMQSQLRRRVRPSHASLTVDAIHLLTVRPDPEHHLFRWEHIRRIDLGGRSTGSSADVEALHD